MKIKEYFLSERQRWSFWFPVLFGFGIGLYFSLPFEPSIWWTLWVIEALIVLAIFCRFDYNKLFVLGAISLIVFGFANIQLKSLYLSRIKPLEAEKVVYLQGQIAQKDFNARGLPRYILHDIKDFDDNPLLQTAKISMSSHYNNFDVGRCIEVVAKIMPPLKTVFVGGFQFERKSFFEGLQANGYALSPAYEVDCLVLKNNLFANLRSKIIARINQVLPKSEAGIVAAIIAGEKGKISGSIINQYRDSGLAHFLSISGLHMSMIAGLMFLLIRYMLVFIPQISLRFNIKKISAVFAIFISIFYLGISGAYVPTQRAFIMTFIVLLGLLFDRKAISQKTISIAAFIILIIAPEVLISASFQMSFGAVIALVAFYERFAGSIHRFSSRFGFIAVYIIGILAADFIASLATLPFAIYHFNRIAIYTTLGNLLAGPIIGLIIMPGVLISLLFMPFGLDVWPLKIVGLGVSKVNQITGFVSHFDYAGFQILSMPTWGLILIVFGALWICLWQQKWRRWGWCLIVFGVLSIFTSQKPELVTSFTGEVLAIKNSDGELVVNGAGSRFEKKLVKEKFAINKKQNITQDKYQNGFSIINNKKTTLPEYTGRRYWHY